MDRKISAKTDTYDFVVKVTPNKSNVGKLDITDIPDHELYGKRVLLRVDFNVPTDKKTGEITDDTRIIGALDTIKYLQSKGAKVIIASHFGRPDGKINQKYSLQKVADKLSELLEQKIQFPHMQADEHHDGSISSYPDYETYIKYRISPLSKKMQPGEIILIENTRFTLAEEKNSPEFSKLLAELCDIYVNDAFGAAHLGHASTEGVAHYRPSYAGLLIKKEIYHAGKALTDPIPPFVAIIGGSKVSDKISVLKNLINRDINEIIIGGGMAYAFLKARGENIGKSLFNEGDDEIAAEIMKEAVAKGVKIHIPIDHIVNTEFENTPGKIVSIIGEEELGMDIGPETIKLFAEVIARAKTIIWNGPMGVYEMSNYNTGTNTIAELMAKATKENGAITIVGGGDSVDATKKKGYDKFMSLVSTGGGAFLEYVEGKILPGIAALDDRSEEK
jgi:phosphoglycerate kinase